MNKCYCELISIEIRFESGFIIDSFPICFVVVVVKIKKKILISSNFSNYLLIRYFSIQ